MGPGEQSSSSRHEDGSFEKEGGNRESGKRGFDPDVTKKRGEYGRVGGGGGGKLGGGATTTPKITVDQGKH